MRMKPFFRVITLTWAGIAAQRLSHSLDAAILVICALGYIASFIEEAREK